MGNCNGCLQSRKRGYRVDNGAILNDAKTLTDKHKGQDQRMEEAKSKMDSPSLPYVNVDSSLRALAGQAEGFGRSAIGGLHGPLYHVTTLEEAETEFHNFFQQGYSKKVAGEIFYYGFIRFLQGESGKWSHFLGELLSLMVEFKTLLLSDKNVLFSFFTSVLGCSRNNLLLPETIGERFEKSKKNQIMHFIVGFALPFLLLHC
ncbi:uncharacterized protein LOC124942581 isoform X2 [Impatiens glandulifera]|uniref:uncharacterized protein LOC124942581 isoform X2 n=1 Tax=Impatiens glandulifera TaxID=253017 RepID=UPI001FB09AC4|nr:uncharacterized protein LOC124942581 isoform X2 [Impatiens glandulifera]